jgi:hypothetical protein
MIDLNRVKELRAGSEPVERKRTLVEDLDRAIQETRACAASGDESTIIAAMEEMLRLCTKYEAIMKNRLLDRRGRSARATLDYLRRCHAFLAARVAGLEALPGDEAAETSAFNRASMEGIARRIKAIEMGDSPTEGA